MMPVGILVILGLLIGLVWLVLSCIPEKPLHKDSRYRGLFEALLDNERSEE